MGRIQAGEVRFEFLGHGSSAEGQPPGSDRLLLDVGNELRPGVIDHHHLVAHQGSTAGLVLSHPDLIAESVNPSRKSGDPFTVVLHRDPDLDCVGSAHLALGYLTTGAFPEGAEALVAYVDRTDAGHPGLSQQQPFTLYAAYMAIGHRLGQRHWPDAQAKWSQCVREGLQLVDFVGREAARRGVPIFDVDAFTAPGLFGPHDREVATGDLDRYRRKLAAPATQARRVVLRLPGQLGGMLEAEALLVREVQSWDDPERVVFFKDLARTDAERARNGRGFVALSVFEPESRYGPRRCIISVAPDSNASLRGLGPLLDRAEAEERRRLHGVDDREQDPVTKQPKLPRRGYTNSDPWYDGRAHGFTIVDAPRTGTLLTAERIEDIFLEFGRSNPADLERLAREGTPATDDTAIRQLSVLANAWRRQQAVPEVPQMDLFISYPQARLEWVRRHVYEPLCAWRGVNQVFFDRHSLAGGAGWLAHIAATVARCRVFLPLYCPEYFHSEFCEWELQMALTRDPIGRRRIVVPFEIERVPLPEYCRLIQVQKPPPDTFTDRLLQVLREVLG